MKKPKSYSPPTDTEVAEFAYYLWEAEGRCPGRDVEYWYQAKAHMVAHRLFEAGMLDHLSPPLLNAPGSALAKHEGRTGERAAETPASNRRPRPGASSSRATTPPLQSAEPQSR